MSVPPRSLSLRLALMFALVSALLLGVIGSYLYRSLRQEVAWRDDQALLGRIERMRALIDDADSIEALRSRPRLYGNMLGNRESLLWVLDATGRPLIEINPAHLPVPRLPPGVAAGLTDETDGAPARLAWLHVDTDGRRLTLVAGKLLAEREQMLSAYRLRLWLTLSAGALSALLLGWLVSQRGLRPVRRLAAHAAGIDVRHLHVRIGDRASLRELRLLGEALDQMLDRLEAGFAQLSRFSGDLAHEMRTPLTNLMGHTQQMLGKARRVEDYQDLLASNQEEYERLARMIDNMLFLARAEQPDASVRRERVALAETVGRLCEYFDGMAEERGIALVDQTAGSVQAEEGLLRRALANLVANALRHGAPGRPVVIDSRTGADWIEIEVCNEGEPIGAAHLPRLFDRFYRCDPSRASPGDSGGLGLAIVRSIMHLHGGEVRVRSDASGTRFTLAFPADPAALRQVRPAAVHAR